MLNETDRMQLVQLKAELAQLSNARSNVSIALDGLATTSAAQLAIQATLLPVLLKKVKQQGRWAAGDWTQSGPDIGPTMAKIEALLERNGVNVVPMTPPPSAPPTVPSEYVMRSDFDTLLDAVKQLSGQVTDLADAVSAK